MRDAKYEVEENISNITDEWRTGRMKELKVVSATFLLVCFVSLKDAISETKRNVFYFTSKAFFIPETIKF